MNWTDILDPKFIINTLGLVGVLGAIFAETGFFFGFFLPGDSLLFTAGLFASKGYMDIYLLVGFSFLMAVLGDSFGYAFGKKIGESLFKRPDSLLFSQRRVEQARSFYNRYGKKTIILARFVPIVRTFAPILAGVGNMDYKTFVKFNIIGGFIWVFGISLAGFFLGKAIPDIDKYLLPIIALIIFISFLPPIFHIIKEKRLKK